MALMANVHSNSYSDCDEEIFVFLDLSHSELITSLKEFLNKNHFVALKLKNSKKKS